VGLAIEKKCMEMSIQVPIVHIKNDLYLFGHQRCNILMKSGNLTLRIGGGYHTFEKYVPNY